MTGALNMGANAISTTNTPTTGAHVVNKTYFDANAVSSSALTAYVKLASATTQQFDSDLIMGTGKTFTHNLSNATQDANDT
jgi:hypothetical protein